MTPQAEELLRQLNVQACDSSEFASFLIRSYHEKSFLYSDLDKAINIPMPRNVYDSLFTTILNIPKQDLPYHLDSLQTMGDLLLERDFKELAFKYPRAPLKNLMSSQPSFKQEWEKLLPKELFGQHTGSLLRAIYKTCGKIRYILLSKALTSDNQEREGYKELVPSYLEDLQVKLQDSEPFPSLEKQEPEQKIQPDDLELEAQEFPASGPELSFDTESNLFIPGRNEDKKKPKNSTKENSTEHKGEGPKKEKYKAVKKEEKYKAVKKEEKKKPEKDEVEKRNGKGKEKAKKQEQEEKSSQKKEAPKSKEKGDASPAPTPASSSSSPKADVKPIAKLSVHDNKYQLKLKLDEIKKETEKYDKIQDEMALAEKSAYFHSKKLTSKGKILWEEFTSRKTANRQTKKVEAIWAGRIYYDFAICEVFEEDGFFILEIDQDLVPADQQEKLTTLMSQAEKDEAFSSNEKITKDLATLWRFKSLEAAKNWEGQLLTLLFPKPFQVIKGESLSNYSVLLLNISLLENQAEALEEILKDAKNSDSYDPELSETSCNGLLQWLSFKSPDPAETIMDQIKKLLSPQKQPYDILDVEGDKDACKVVIYPDLIPEHLRERFLTQFEDSHCLANKGEEGDTQWFVMEDREQAEENCDNLLAWQEN